MRPVTSNATPSAFPVELVLGGAVGPIAAAPLEELAERLSRAAARRDVFAGLAAFDPERPVQRILLRVPELEVVLGCWLPGQASPVHDHSGSRGATAIVFGELVETRFLARGDRAIAEREVVVGRLGTLLERADTIHRLENRSSRPAVSLHVHVPPARGGRIWTPAPAA